MILIRGRLDKLPESLLEEISRARSRREKSGHPGAALVIITRAKTCAGEKKMLRTCCDPALAARFTDVPVAMVTGNKFEITGDICPEPIYVFQAITNFP